MKKIRVITLALSLAAFGVAPATASATGKPDKPCQGKGKGCKKKIDQSNVNIQQADSTVKQQLGNVIYVKGKNNEITQVLVSKVDSEAINLNETEQKASQSGSGGGKIKQGNTNVQVATSTVTNVNTNVAVAVGKDNTITQVIDSKVNSSAVNSNSTNQSATQKP